MLQVIPEAPRLAKDSFPTNWDWGSLVSNVPKEILTKAASKVENLFGKNPPPPEAPREEIDEPATNGNTAVETPQEEEASQVEEVNNNDISQTEVNGNDDDSGVVVNEDAEPEPESENATENVEEIDQSEVVEATPVDEKMPPPPPPPVEEEEASPARVETADDHQQELSNGVQEEERDRSDSRMSVRQTQDEEEEDAESNQGETEAQPMDVDSTSRPVSATQQVEGNVEQDNVDIVDNEDDNEGVIEGVVNGENEIESVNNEGRGLVDPDGDVDVGTLVGQGNMEQLAALVLNGHGDKLAGHSSENAELQSFLENVPAYMVRKIYSVLSI